MSWTKSEYRSPRGGVATAYLLDHEHRRAVVRIKHELWMAAIYDQRNNNLDSVAYFMTPKKAKQWVEEYFDGTSAVLSPD